MAKRSVREYKNFQPIIWKMAMDMARMYAQGQFEILAREDGITSMYLQPVWFEQKAEILYKTVTRANNIAKRDPSRKEQIVLRNRLGIFSFDVKEKTRT